MPPTLDEMGVRYVSPSGLVQVKPSVRIELDGFVPQDAPAWHLEDTSPFVAGRASLFVDLFVGRHLFASTELRLDRGQPARSGPLQGHLQQAFVRLTPAPGTNFHIQGGKFVSPFGGYPGRAHTSADPVHSPAARLRPPHRDLADRSARGRRWHLHVEESSAISRRRLADRVGRTLPGRG